MITKPYWTQQQIEIFEFCFDQIQHLNLTLLTFETAASHKYPAAILKNKFGNEDHLVSELVKYWAWKETWEINKVLIRIKNPFERLFTLMKWGFRNNRYMKMNLYIIRMHLPDEAIAEMDQVNRRKHEFLIELFTDRGIPEARAKIKAQSILPFYYGWSRDKEDQIKSDIEKFGILSIFKTMLFPELFKGEKASVKEL